MGQVLFKRFKRIGFIPSPYQIAIRLPKALIGLFYILLCRINAVLHRHALKQLRDHYHKVGIVVIEVNGFCPALYPGCSPGSNAFGQLVGPHTVAGAEVEEHVCQLLLSIIVGIKAAADSNPARAEIHDGAPKEKVRRQQNIGCGGGCKFTGHGIGIAV